MTEKEKPKATTTRKPKPRVRLLKARLVASSGRSALVEWQDEDGNLQRGYIPVEKYHVDRSGVEKKDLEYAVPYGVDWTQAEIGIDLAALDQELKKHGFWTVEDLKTNPHLVNTIIMRVANLGLEALNSIGGTK